MIQQFYPEIFSYILAKIKVGSILSITNFWLNVFINFTNLLSRIRKFRQLLEFLLLITIFSTELLILKLLNQHIFFKILIF